MKENDLIFILYSDARTVFRLKDVAMLSGETNFDSLKYKLNYYIRTGRLLNPRKGIYCKQGYNKDELACRIFAPAYISLEYVLQKAGVVFQYDSRFTMVSYLNREIEINEDTFVFKKIKKELLVPGNGIEQRGAISIALPERAFLDMLYLNGEMYFDNLRLLDRDKVEQILPIYKSKVLDKRAIKILKNDRYK
ncbi:MAG: hypothetical protein LBG17_04855 [Bacteroidales bacterium]|jgi:hypothetical protein|nr:hypothetical protein [Bacteroidales bacterium]